MITGRRPTDNTFDGIIDLCKHVEMALNNSVMEVIDKELVMELENENGTTGGPSSKRRVNSMISLLKLGMLCSVEMPSRRMSTKEIIKELHLIKKTLAYREEGSR
uniref:Uncharacterized protein n=1 Tax=Arundo donax TaxID=35708 RepID=A0A0A8YYJ1_ARUDO